MPRMTSRLMNLWDRSQAMVSFHFLPKKLKLILIGGHNINGLRS